MSRELALKPLLQPVPDTSLGPAMLALPNDMQRDFVRILVQTGCRPSQAAAAAGYTAASKQHLTAAGHRLAHDQRIQAAIHEECLRLVRAHGPMAFSVLITIAQDKTAKPKDRLTAATEILNRGGFHPVSEHKLTVTHQTEADKDREILALATELGLDDAAAAKLLGKPVVREAEYEIISEPRGRGRPITNLDRTPEERAANLASKYRTPEERAARNSELAEQRRAEGKDAYRRAQIAREAEKLGLTLEEYEMLVGSEGLEDVLGLDDDMPTRENLNPEGATNP